ncbi:F0F1 ATP synthase subunit gamma [Amycolatopsis alkalitolerans]|uniref:ATP synthase gamma chain n=1 Tax=Amycolatopsis alkalitolerans TaxID=2547244 RepID=A0A5C4LSU6_9PSEU|nr:F0F1 ATP synthase subunit gamma [Amycolatopsis alkalitolerans]TNC22096.1 F0F1 ATP synthase subunit gamma [Amycolatopsis alkalitolerans]
MPAQIRVLRRRIRSTQSMRKITKAQELIATSRITKAQARVEASRPYAAEITRVLSAAADSAALNHPLLVERESPRRVGVLVVTSDRGLCGGYNANVLRRAEELQALLREQGKEPHLYVVGRKALNYYRFRQREVEASWTGFSEQPAYTDASAAAGPMMRAFRAGSDEDEEARETYLPEGEEETTRLAGVDELHIVYTEFNNMLSQTAVAKRLAPLEVEYGVEGAVPTLYEFEPDADALFRALGPKYLGTRIFAALLESAASESASRRRAMKAATDNANDLIRDLTLEANRARQAQITQEISEIVGGVDALAAAGSDD